MRFNDGVFLGGKGEGDSGEVETKQTKCKDYFLTFYLIT